MRFSINIILNFFDQELVSSTDKMGMVFVQKREVKLRKNILIVDNNRELESLVKEPLLKELENTGVSPIVVRAKDGAEAAIKSENQKFDMVIIDTEVPRLMDGGFVYGIHTYKNTQDAEVIVISQRELSELPESLQRSRYFKKPVTPSELINAMVSILNIQYQGKKPDEATSAAAVKYAVDVRVINAVIKATTNVLTQFGVKNIKMQGAKTMAANTPLQGEVSSVIDIRSKYFKGYLTVSFDKSSFLELVSSMLMEPQTEITPDNQDAVGEINNIIFGNAKSEITSYGVEMTVPKVIMGKDQTIPTLPGAAGMLIPFATDAGEFYLSVVALPCDN